MLQMKAEGSLLENLLLLGEADLFVLLRPLRYWMRPTHIMEDNLLYLKFTDLNVSLI